MLVSCNGRQQQSDYAEDGKNGVDYSFEVLDMKADSSGNIYIADKTRIYKIDKERKQTTFVDGALGNCRNICIGEDRLYALDESDCSIKEFTLKGKFVNQYELGEINKYNCIEMEYMKDRIIMLGLDNMDSSKSFVITFDLKNNSQNVFGTNIGIDITVYSDKLLVRELTGGIFVYDCITGKKTGECIANELYKDMCYDMQDELLFCLGTNSITCIDPEEKIKNTVFHTGRGSYKQIASTPDFLAVYNSDTNTIDYIIKDDKNREQCRIDIITYYEWLGRGNDFKYLIDLAE